jgi:hypothetical protein
LGLTGFGASGDDLGVKLSSDIGDEAVFHDPLRTL